MNNLLPDLGMSLIFLILEISFAKLAHIAHFIYPWSYLFHMLWLMCFQVYFKPSHRYIKRELESSAKTKISTPLRNSPFAVAPRISPSFGGESKARGLHLWYNLHSFIYDQRGRKCKKGSNDSVFGDSCQRGRKYEPKAKGSHHHQVWAQSKTAPPPISKT